MTESQVRALFNRIADGEAAPSRVDTQLALRRGRARLRWHRACMAGAPVLAAVAVVAVALAVAAGPGRPRTSRAAGAGPAAPREFSPLIENVSFGWLPAGQSVSGGGFLRTEVYLYAGSQHGLSGWWLNVFARGQCHLTGPLKSLKCSSPPGGDGGMTAQFSAPAPAVDGHTAFWAGTRLVWQYARGGWAGLETPISGRQHANFSTLRHDPRAQQEAVKIAGHLRFGAATPALAFPARFTGLASQWRVSQVDFTADAGVLGVQSYVLTTRASRFLPHVGDLGVWVNAASVEIHPAPSGSTCTPRDPAYKNTSETINGYRVVVQSLITSGLPHRDVCAARADGLWAYIEEFGPHPTIGVASLFRHLRLLGTNPANWTSNPIG